MTLPDDGTRDLGVQATALRALDYILRIELTEARWERVDGILTIATEAARAGDLTALQAATNELRAIGPVRVIRIGGTPAGPPPVKVRERAGLMRAVVSAARTDADGDSDEEEEDSDGQ